MAFPSDFPQADCRWPQRVHRAGRVCVVVLGLAGALGVLVEWQREAALARIAQELVAETESATLPDVGAPRSAEPRRPHFRHSVVMGGLYSREDVERAVRLDAVVDAHYADIDVDRVRTDVVTEPRQAYVSYRIGDKVFWTRRPVTIQPGETVLSDGTSAIRARCGNRISDVPMEPTSGVEPAEGELDEPLDPALARVENPVAAMPRVVPFFPGGSDSVGADGALPAGGIEELFPPMGFDESGGNPGDFSIPAGGGNPPGGGGNPPGGNPPGGIPPGDNPPGGNPPGGNPPGGNPPGGNPPGGNPPGGNPPGGNPPGGNPPGGDPPGGDPPCCGLPPGGDPPCCGIPPIDVPPIGEPPSDPPPSVPEPGPLALLAVGFAAVAVQRLLSQRRED